MSAVDTDWFALAAAVDARTGLERLRDLLARQIAEADTPLVASLARELRATILAIEALPAAPAGGIVDQLTARRAARGAS